MSKITPTKFAEYMARKKEIWDKYYKWASDKELWTTATTETRKLEDEYGITYEDCMEFLATDEYLDAWLERKRTIGPAISKEQSEQIKERLDELWDLNYEGHLGSYEYHLKVQELLYHYHLSYDMFVDAYDYYHPIEDLVHDRKD